MSAKHKKKKSAGKKQNAQPVRKEGLHISSWRSELNSVLLIVLCVMLTASSSYNFFTGSGKNVYAPMLLLEICLFKYVYDTGKAAEKRSVVNSLALVVCGVSIAALAVFTVLSLVHS